MRLGVEAPAHSNIVQSLNVVDDQLGVSTDNGTFWHRFNFDGYGETRDGGSWDIIYPDGSQATIGRAWPIFAGERGEYELLAGGPAASRLSDIARTGSEGYMLPEQVWDENPPSGQPPLPR